MAIPAASSRQDLLLAATALVASLAFLDVTVVNVALPDIGRSFGTRDLVDLSWCVTAYAAVFAAALVPAGRLADVLGHRRMLIARTSAFGAASAVAAAGTESRCPRGGSRGAGDRRRLDGAGVVRPAARRSSQARRSSAVGIWSAAAATSAFVGPTVGGVLVEIAGWRALFALNLPIGLMLLAYFVWLAPRRRPKGGVLPDPLGVALVSAAIALPVIALTQSRTWGWADGRPLAMALAGIGKR